MLHRLLSLIGVEREAVRIDNVIRCQPPHDWLEGAPWQYGAIEHCRRHLDESLNDGPEVVVALGNTALKRLLDLSGKKVGINNFHGTINRDPQDRFWIVPTFHPSHLQRGSHNLVGTVLWDLQRALQVLEQGHQPDPGQLVCDPPIGWFNAWVEQVAQAVKDEPYAYPLSVDVETPDKAGGRDEDDIGVEDRSFQILRVNVAVHPDEGITVPFAGPYVDSLRRLLGLGTPLWFWNQEYDLPRLAAAEVLPEAPVAVDLMWLWHVLQSDLPRGLGFVAPFYSTYGAWKHFADKDPVRYAAVDALQTHRIGLGVIADLQRQGMWEMASRHVLGLHSMVLKPAQAVGVRIDRARLSAFNVTLSEKASKLLGQLQESFPDELKALTPKQGLTKRPPENVLHVKASAFTRKGDLRKGKPASEIKLDLYKRARIIEQTVEKEVWVCATCGAVDVPRRHRCPKRSAAEGGRDLHREPSLSLAHTPVTRYFWQEPFNPDSPPQVLAYLKYRKHAAGKAKKTRKDTTNRETLERLTKTGDPFYARLLDYRAVMKVKGTYVDGTERRLDHEDRVHPEPTFKPSTMRLSYQNPNITNVITRSRPGAENLAEGFRRCVVASPGCRLLEVDFAGSEAVDVGWFSRDPRYIRLAKLGVHAGLASHILGKPYDPTRSDADLAEHFAAIKKSPDPSVKAVYERAKRFVHGFSYGLTIPGMVLQFPETFPTRKVAEQYAELFRAMAPEIVQWQRIIRERAFKQHYLGGSDHPFGYKHWFWSVYTYAKISAGQYWKILTACKVRGVDESEAPVTTINGQYFRIGLGEDGKRCVAFYPQSTTAGKLKDVMLRLFTPGSPTYIGDAYFGKTPLRAPIHDSLLLEIPIRTFDLVASVVCQEMQRPFPQMPCPPEWGFGPALATGISAKTGLDWATMEDLKVPGFSEVSGDRIVTAAEEDQQDDVNDLGREVA